jgi:hypothetical protein
MFLTKIKEIPRGEVQATTYRAYASSVGMSVSRIQRFVRRGIHPDPRPGGVYLCVDVCSLKLSFRQMRPKLYDRSCDQRRTRLCRYQEKERSQSITTTRVRRISPLRLGPTPSVFQIPIQSLHPIVWTGFPICSPGCGCYCTITRLYRERRKYAGRVRRVLTLSSLGPTM